MEKTAQLDDITLHLLSAEDADCISQLMHRIYPPVYQHIWKDGGGFYLNKLFTPEPLAEELSRPEEPSWRVVFEKETIGVLKLNLHAPLPSAENDNAIKLHRLYLDPTLHSRGIGKRLLTFVERVGRGLEKDILWLEAMDTQTQALNFYEKNGFKPCGHFTLDYPQVRTELRGMVRMKKHLRAS